MRMYNKRIIKVNECIQRSKLNHKKSQLITNQRKVVLQNDISSHPLVLLTCLVLLKLDYLQTLRSL